MDANFFALPEDITEADRDALTGLILSETAELEVVYPEPQTFCTVVKAWSHARVGAWSRILEALTEEYNPVHNYDRYENETGTDTGTRTETDTGTRTETDTGTRTETDTGTRNETEAEDISDTASDTTTGQATGFNSTTFTDDKKTLSNGTGNRDRDVTKSETRNLSRGETRNLSRGETRNLSHGETRNLANSRTLHAYGNIGVTTAADMITQEAEVRKVDLLRIITDEFTRYFCLAIY